MEKFTRIPLPLEQVTNPQLYHIPLLVELLGKIPRWASQTRHPYTVLEHVKIGGRLIDAGLFDAGLGDQLERQKLKQFWLIHDLEEAAFVGDVRTKFKGIYTNEQYAQDALHFGRQIRYQLQLADYEQYAPIVKLVDLTMLAAEFSTIVEDYVITDDVIERAFELAAPKAFKYACQILKRTELTDQSLDKPTERSILSDLGVPPSITYEQSGLITSLYGEQQFGEPQKEIPSELGDDVEAGLANIVKGVQNTGNELNEGQ